MADKETPHTFAAVFAQEQALFTSPLSSAMAVDNGQPKPADATMSSLYASAAMRQFAGLALSGGGMRSATFSLGVLQALADLGLLSKFDYLSTVSGGGYIGGWLSKWIHGEPGGVAEVEKQLRSGGDGPAPRTEPPQVQFLRQYGNQLTPRSGVFTSDSWALIYTYVRNTLLNMSILAAWIALLFLMPRAMLVITEELRGHQRALVLPLSVLIFMFCVFSIALNISLKGPALQNYGWLQDQKWVLRSVCYPMMIAAFLGSIAFVEYRDDMISYLDNINFFSLEFVWLLIPGMVCSFFWISGWLLAQVLNRRAALAPNAPPYSRLMPLAWRDNGSKTLLHAICATGALAVGSLLMMRVCKTLDATAMRGSINIHLLTLGMPAIQCVFGATMTLMIALIGRPHSDPSREWWALRGTWAGIAVWLSVCCITFYLPPLLAWAFDRYATSASLVTGVTAMITYLGLRLGSDKETGQLGKSGKLELVAQLAPYAFGSVFLGLLTTGLLMLMADGLPDIDYPPLLDDAAVLTLFFERYQALSHSLAWHDILRTVILCMLAALILSWRLDINEFSLHMVYRLRLARAFFGASNTGPLPRQFTGFDSCDELPLNDMLHLRQYPGEPMRAGPVPLPYHLLNSTVKMIQGTELGGHAHEAANFVFSPAFCGFELPAANNAAGGFRPTAVYATKSLVSDDHANGIELGAAVAISGAAANPNMGNHSSPPLSFLMTLFNLRFGRWLPNPAAASWQRASPRFGLFYILKEVFGGINVESDFLYLSDGGHFENLGLYELVRRRCQLIVVVDASCDSEDCFKDLGNAMRRCLADFNVPITLDVSKLHDAADGTPRSSFVNGRIHYHQADGGTQEGVLLYLKPALTGGENADIFNYSRLHPSFPHETTTDQWFDESQFDSYRGLGRHIATLALGPAVAAAARSGSKGDERGFISRLGDALTTPRPPPRRMSIRRKAPTGRGRA